MSNCREEATDDDHGHGHGGHGHSHGGGHSCQPDDPDGNSLFAYIDTEKVSCLNEREQGSGKNCIKSNVEKHDDTRFVISEEDDPELILHIPFTVAVKLKSFCIIGGANGEAPSKVKLFTNREDLDFEDAQEMPGVQTFELTEDFEGEIDYPVRASKFQNISSLTIYVSENFGADSTKITFLGLKGEGTTARRGVVECTYEASAQLKDHQTTRADNVAGRSELS
mmetsp:Transcript_16851/g.28920  ORF Transcript_16851/g.28920 Transcript_16851/m.28920 type:complete len:224 (+) Transcript_16851:275-946(+)